MQPKSSIRRLGTSIAAGTFGVGTVILAVAMAGSFFGANFVVDTAKNPNGGLVYGTRGVETPTEAEDTGSGGLAKYDTITAQSPFNSSTATLRGLKVGSGVVRYVQLDVIANPKGAVIDCSVVNGPLTATGGTAIISNAVATGSTLTYSTPFVLGPTQRIKCGSLTNPGSGLNAKLFFTTTYSEVTN